MSTKKPQTIPDWHPQKELLEDDVPSEKALDDAEVHQMAATCHSGWRGAAGWQRELRSWWWWCCRWRWRWWWWAGWGWSPGRPAWGGGSAPARDGTPVPATKNFQFGQLTILICWVNMPELRTGGGLDEVRCRKALPPLQRGLAPSPLSPSRIPTFASHKSFITWEGKCDTKCCWVWTKMVELHHQMRLWLELW